MLAAVNTAEEGWRDMGYQAYAGYARRLSNGPTVDVGVSALRVRYHELPFGSVANEEVYAGLVGRHASVRLSYAPDYFEQDVKTLYLDLGAAFRPAPDWRVFGHAGLLRRVSGGAGSPLRRQRYDLSAGVARRIGRAEVVLQATRAGPGDRRGPDYDGVQVSASWFF